jgi:arsenate reductase
MAEALINSTLEGVDAKSSGVKASGKVNSNAEQLLTSKGMWRKEYHSKELSTLINEDFDLVVTVCGNAKETCPMFPKAVKTVHVGFEDPDGKEYEAFVETFNKIKNKLLPIITKELK